MSKACVIFRNRVLLSSSGRKPRTMVITSNFVYSLFFPWVYTYAYTHRHLGLHTYRHVNAKFSFIILMHGPNIGTCLNCFFVAVINYPDKSNFRRKGFIMGYSSKGTQVVMTGEDRAVVEKPWYKEEEAVWSYCIHTQEAENDKFMVQFSPFLHLQSRSQAWEWYCPQWTGLLTSIFATQTCQKAVFQVLLDSVNCQLTLATTA